MNAASEDIKDILVAAGVGIFKTNLFIGTMPASPDANVTIRDTPWKPPELNYEIDYPGIQTLVRGARGQYTATQVKAVSVNTVLHGYQETINDTRYILVAAAHSPIYVGKDEQNRPMFSINFEIQRTTA